jgi:LysM repeat protein
MTLSSALWRLLMLAPLAVWVSGCFPLADGPTDEEKDPHYLTGKSRESGMDYDGAIAAFENALISNPKSAAAHFELGLLEEKKNNYAAAIYHFEKHLELRPESNMAETINQHVIFCKFELAKTVPFAMFNRQVQDELRRLNATNAVLRDLVDQLKAQSLADAAAFSNRLALVTQAAAQAQAQAQVRSQAQAQAPAPTLAYVEPERRSSFSEKPPVTGAFHSSVRLTPSPKTHVIKPGETLATISKRYNVKLSSLQAANPGADPRRLKAGQILNIPGGKD